ncbi:hypothetical protein SAMN05421847_2370 [Halpernia humi]|uniref:Uncharacterized protein n=1 Tax=Halpernia humi TaxID=493375 RepID=A0A1H6ACH5_9FLAO|nr:hypothetical protein [Halpernia humi]SEG46449.1 hypothetical protein SAMN05421847_2370 [Halpernia humi]
MKKIILGLILSVGVSGFAVASTIDVKSESLAKSEVLSSIETITKITENISLVSCSHRYYLRIYDCNGGFEDKDLGQFEGSCGGASDGTSFMHRQTLEADCGPQ